MLLENTLQQNTIPDVTSDEVRTGFQYVVSRVMAVGKIVWNQRFTARLSKSYDSVRANVACSTCN
ncbi:hypothetical protein PHLH6_41410 [Pseudomonas sp. Seg1]|nr:hypothetical protein PHLH6_41410 [Pseudomonas sp. Seg1]